MRGPAKRRVALATCRNRIVDGLEGELGEHAIMPQALDLDEAAPTSPNFSVRRVKARFLSGR
jgi:hypothetical protein